MRWAGNVARMGEKRKAYRLCGGKARGKIPLDVDERIILGWILER
jgi:hypothetical protein